MVAYQDIRRKLAAFAAGRLPLQEFKDWVIPLSWDIESRGIPEAVAPIHLVVGMMAEHALRHRTLRSLRAETGKVVKSWRTPEKAPLMVREGTADIHPKRGARPAGRARSGRR